MRGLSKELVNAYRVLRAKRLAAGAASLRTREGTRPIL